MTYDEIYNDIDLGIHRTVEKYNFYKELIIDYLNAKYTGYYKIEFESTLYTYMNMNENNEVFYGVSAFFSFYENDHFYKHQEVKISVEDLYDYVVFCRKLKIETLKNKINGNN